MQPVVLLEEIQGPGKNRWGRFFLGCCVLFVLALAFHLTWQKQLNDEITKCLVAGIIILSLLSLFANIKMVTQLREDGIYVRFPPFQPAFSKYEWKDITEVYIREYNALYEYGGWGIRFGLMGIKYGQGGKAYIISGNQGIQLEMKDGTKVLIGTQKPDEISSILRKL
ncbi:MAG TPA: hypothetical protein VJ499_10245 [Flavisolibacter sp.]|nr:hypothetical protein [Flavisolibacter sp.]